MKIRVLLFLFAYIPCVGIAQTIQEKKIYNDQGQLIEIAKIIKIDEFTDAFEITTYNPDNPSLIRHVNNYMAIKENKNNTSNNSSLFSSPTLSNYMKSSTVYQHGKSVLYHDNGKIKQEEQYVHGNLEGEAIVYDIDGNIISIGSYSKNEKDGEWTIYFTTNNKYYRKGCYVNGKKHGIWKTYLESGSLVSEENYIHGDITGDYKVYISTVAPPPDLGRRALRGLCGFVGDQTPDDGSSVQFRYVYQRKLFEAAGIDINLDSEEVIGKKIAKVWKENEVNLICSNTQFDTTNGSIIKYAISMQFNSFIYDLAFWKVNFNKIDESDGKTVLDYLDDKIEQFKGTPVEKGLREYHILLRKAGAKNKSEL